MKASVLMVLGLAAGLVACDAQSDVSGARLNRGDDDGPLRAIARLDCPERQGRLERDLMSPDGRSCAYRGRDGSEVELTLIPLEGRPASAVLTPMEAPLRALVPPPPADASQGLTASVDADDEKARVRLPGLSIDAGGDRARVRMPGVAIDANGGAAKINVSDGDEGAVSVNANNDGAEIRTRKETAGGLRTSYVLAREQPAPSGWRLVGYEARGPVNGPLVVASVRARGDRDDAFDEAKDLLDRNVGR